MQVGGDTAWTRKQDKGLMLGVEQVGRLSLRCLTDAGFLEVFLFEVVE